MIAEELVTAVMNFRSV